MLEEKVIFRVLGTSADVLCGGRFFCLTQTLQTHRRLLEFAPSSISKPCSHIQEEVWAARCDLRYFLGRAESRCCRFRPCRVAWLRGWKNGEKTRSWN